MRAWAVETKTLLNDGNVSVTFFKSVFHTVLMFSKRLKHIEAGGCDIEIPVGYLVMFHSF